MSLKRLPHKIYIFISCILLKNIVFTNLKTKKNITHQVKQTNICHHLLILRLLKKKGWIQLNRLRLHNTLHRIGRVSGSEKLMRIRSLTYCMMEGGKCLQYAGFPVAGFSIFCFFSFPLCQQIIHLRLETNHGTVGGFEAGKFLESAFIKELTEQKSSKKIVIQFEMLARHNHCVYST